MIIVLSASCLIYPSFNRNVFLAEMIIWPNTHVIFCQPYELPLKFSLTLCLLLSLLTPLPVWDNIVKLRGLLSKQLLFAFNVKTYCSVTSKSKKPLKFFQNLVKLVKTRQTVTITFFCLFERFMDFWKVFEKISEKLPH